MSSDPTDFTDFYEGVWGRRPFNWQVRLAAQVLEAGRWPSVIDLPTGAGKTSALDIAVWAMACDSARFPRRVVFVVDRRVIVDQVSGHAEELSRRIGRSGNPTVVQVRQRLSEMGGDPRDVLALAALRGGSAIGNQWARWPDQPCVLASTVDQFGSRLLFRGYGVRRAMWPVHAGLTGNDTLVLLDEVHLAVPFAQTLRAIEDTGTDGLLPRRWQVVEMSATPTEPSGERFQLDRAADIDAPGCEVFAQRMNAVKRARLIAAGRRSEAADQVLAREIPRLLNDQPGSVVGVVVNRVASARAVASALDARGTNVELITGRMRPWERDRAVERVLEAADPDREQGDGDGRLVVVATQCIEVGADLSFDALITEAAPIDALKQRFGRLDRRGTLAAAGRSAQAVIIGVESAVRAPDDPVYGSALATTWQALTERFREASFDVGPMSDDLVGVGDAADRGRAPLLLPSHRSAFAQTSPVPQVDPDPAPFLHGFQDVDPEVSVVWRDDVGDYSVGEASGRAEAIRAALELSPPHPAEAMAVPIRSLRRWLTGEPSIDPLLADAPAAVTDEAPSHSAGARRVFRWRGPAEGDSDLVSISSLRPGDVLVVPSEWGGIESGTWSPGSRSPVADIGNDVGAGAWRVHPAVVGDETVPLPDEGADATIVKNWLRDRGAPDEPLTTYLGWDPKFDHGSGGFREFYAVPRGSATAALLDGNDEANSFTGQYSLLDDHLAAVGDLAGEMGRRCHLPDAVVDDLRLAGELHDVGKADPRFQRWLHGSDLSMARTPGLLAKSPRRTSRQMRQRARTWAGYPEGMRHELISGALIAANAGLLARAHDRELVEHLVVTHHGRCRPLPDVVSDPSPVTVEYTIGGLKAATSSEVAEPVSGASSVERFWRLVDRYGWHGLAWLEAILRLADHRLSEQNGPSHG